ncbi:MAG: dipeptide/oligopeptide/nickel ABC transporter permease/ATP-binding protein [Acidimicrobiia bacterium]
MTDIQNSTDQVAAPVHAVPPAGDNVYADEAVAKAVTPTRRVIKRLAKNPLAIISIVYLLTVGFIGLFASTLAPYDPAAQKSPLFLGPSGKHWLGTDDLGRDIWSRMMFAAQISMKVTLSSVFVAMFFAVPVGLFSGYKGGRIDNAIQRTLDSVQSIPFFVLAMVISAIRNQDPNAVIWALSAALFPGFVRLIRANSLAVTEETFIEASRSMGTPTRRILFRRVLPSVISPLIVQASMALGTGLVAEAGLSFIGFGVKPPEASWGSMLNRAFQYIFNHPYQMVPPAVAIVLTVLAFNTLGDALRDALGLAPAKPPRGTKRGRLGATVVTRAQSNDSGIVPSSGAILAVEHLSVGFAVEGQIRKVVDDVNFEVLPGEVVALVGESGSGKTVTSQAIMRLISSPPGQIMDGRVFFDGRDLLSMDFNQLREIRGNDLAMVFQDPMSSLNPAFTIGNQMVEAIRLHQKVTKAEAREQAKRMLDKVGIPEAATRLRQYPHELSGGMRQRVLIAMSLLNNPKLLIADEPTTALDVTVQAQILDLLKDLRREFNMGLIFVTHDLGVVADLCDKVMVMYAGEIVEQAPVHELFANPRHPYTKALLGAIPQTAAAEERLFSIPGVVPVPGRWPTGCRFAGRCEYATAACDAQKIELTQISADRASRCIRHSDLAVASEAAR